MLVTPRTIAILNIFEPIILPIEISVCFLIAATIEAVNSGTLVPNATMVIDITRLLTPKLNAISEAPSTRKSAPKASPNEDATIINNDTPKLSCFMSATSSSSLCSFLDLVIRK